MLDMTSEERDVYFVSGTNADWQRQTSLANSTTLILMVEVADLSQSSLLVEMLSRVLQSVEYGLRMLLARHRLLYLKYSKTRFVML